MKNTGSVCVLMVAVIFIGAVCAQSKTEEFLLKYGYLTERSGNNRAENPTPEEIEEAILKFQRFTGLPQTGRLDETTKKKMIAPRCGVKDLGGDLAEFRVVSKWPKNLITWKIRQFSKTSKLSHGQQRRAMRNGLKRWADVTPLKFRETSDKPTLDILFGKKNHGDNHPFDGRGGVLAHAFFPRNGRTHFDDDENWVNDKTSGTHLETVAAHEFGHALGLGHSAEPQSIMAPYYQTFPDGFTLHKDDVAGIQKLYGKNPNGPITTTTRKTRKTTPTSTPRSTTTTSSPRGKGFCNHVYRSIDAAMRIDGNDFVFVDNGEVIDGRTGQKMAIQNLFYDGPNTVHAAVYSKDFSKAYLFKDNQVWAYTLSHYGQFRLVKDFPKRFTNKYVKKPECAMLYNFHGERIFLVKDGHFVEFMPYYETVAPYRGYKTSEFFLNIPSRIDAVISSDREIQFIVKDKAYTMPNDIRVVSIRGKPTNLVFNKCQN